MTDTTATPEFGEVATSEQQYIAMVRPQVENDLRSTYEVKANKINVTDAAQFFAEQAFIMNEHHIQFTEEANEKIEFLSERLQKASTGSPKQTLIRWGFAFLIIAAFLATIIIAGEAQ